MKIRVFLPTPGPHRQLPEQPNQGPRQRRPLSACESCRESGHNLPRPCAAWATGKELDRTAVEGRFLADGDRRFT